MVTEFRRKETIFNTFLLPSKLSSSSHMIPLSLLSSPRTAFLLEADSKNDIWEVKRRIWKDYSQSNMIMKKKNPLYWVRKGKLGYSCLSTNRCLSSKCHRKHRLPLKQMGNYMGERVRTATQRKKTAVCCFFPSSILQPWSKKKKKEIPLLCTFTDRRWPALPGSGCRNSCARHGTSPCSVWCVSRTPRRPDTPGCSVRAADHPLSADCAGAPTGRGRVLSHCSSRSSGDKTKVGEVCNGFYSQSLLPELPQVEFWTNNCHGNHYLQQFAFFAHFCPTFAKHQSSCSIYFYQSVLRARASMLSVPYCTETTLFNGLAFDHPQWRWFLLLTVN